VETIFHTDILINDVFGLQTYLCTITYSAVNSNVVKCKRFNGYWQF